jgi:TolB-like protein/DNA-binding winged helix-turn-helix (wHTH) protein
LGEISVKDLYNSFNNQIVTNLLRKNSMTLRRAENLGAYRIDDIVVDTVRREVKRGGKTLKLGKLSYRLLVLLAEEAPRVVDRGEIIDRIWAGRFVTADTVKQRIVLLRKALGDDARAPRYISVVRGQGYKLIARVQPLEIGSLEENGWRPQRAATIAIGSAFAAIIAVAWLLSLWFAEPRDEAPRSIAVMAFADLSEDGGRQWFADGLSNDIGTRLQDIPDLRVAAWTSTQSLAAKQFTAGEIGTILDVSHVLDGAIRFVGEKFRVDVQLNEASTDTQLWADRYEGAMTDILTVQEEIAVDVADQLRVMLSGSSQSLDQTTPDVWARFQRAAYINRNLLGESFDEARSLLEQAIERDPNYFPAGNLFLPIGICPMWVCSAGPKPTSGPMRSSSRLWPSGETGLNSFPTAHGKRGQLEAISKLQRAITNAFSGRSPMRCTSASCRFLSR